MSVELLISPGDHIRNQVLVFFWLFLWAARSCFAHTAGGARQGARLAGGDARLEMLGWREGTLGRTS